IGGAAAGFLAVRIIADDADGEGVAGLEQQLAADEEAIAVVDVAFGAAGRVDHMIVAVAAHIDAVETEGDLLAERAGNADLAANLVEIAVGQVDMAAEVELRPGADDVDEAGRRVAAEQGALRAAQHLDPLDVAKLV